MLVTEEGISMFVRPVQPENAFHPMLVTEEGMVTLFRPLQPEYLQVVLFRLLAC